jgi:hypothetical protein
MPYSAVCCVTQVASGIVNGSARGDYHLRGPDVGLNLLVASMAGFSPRMYNWVLEVTHAISCSMLQSAARFKRMHSDPVVTLTAHHTPTAGGAGPFHGAADEACNPAGRPNCAATPSRRKPANLSWLCECVWLLCSDKEQTSHHSSKPSDYTWRSIGSIILDSARCPW